MSIPQQKLNSPSSVLAQVGRRESENRRRNHDAESASMPSIDMHPQTAEDLPIRGRISSRGRRIYSSKSPASPVLSPIDSDSAHGSKPHGDESHSPFRKSLSPRGDVPNSTSPLTPREGTARNLTSSQKEAVNTYGGFSYKTAKGPLDDKGFNPHEHGNRL